MTEITVWKVDDIGEHRLYGMVRVLEVVPRPVLPVAQHLIVEQIYQPQPRTRRQVSGAELRPVHMEGR